MTFGTQLCSFYRLECCNKGKWKAAYGHCIYAVICCQLGVVRMPRGLGAEFVESIVAAKLLETGSRFSVETCGCGLFELLFARRDSPLTSFVMSGFLLETVEFCGFACVFCCCIC